MIKVMNVYRIIKMIILRHRFMRLHYINLKSFMKYLNKIHIKIWRLKILLLHH